MSFEKPCRIRNKAISIHWDDLLQASHPVQASLKELADHYELFIRIDTAAYRQLSLFLGDGRLWLMDSGVFPALTNDVVGSFMFPADACPDGMRGYRNESGIRVVLPLKARDGHLQQVPLLEENFR